MPILDSSPIIKTSPLIPIPRQDQVPDNHRPWESVDAGHILPEWEARQDAQCSCSQSLCQNIRGRHGALQHQSLPHFVLPNELETVPTGQADLSNADSKLWVQEKILVTFIELFLFSRWLGHRWPGLHVEERGPCPDWKGDLPAKICDWEILQWLLQCENFNR